MLSVTTKALWNCREAGPGLLRVHRALSVPHRLKLPLKSLLLFPLQPRYNLIEHKIYSTLSSGGVMAERKEHWLYTSKYERRGKLVSILFFIWLLAAFAGLGALGAWQGVSAFLVGFGILMAAQVEVMAWLLRYLVKLADKSIQDGKVLGMADISNLKMLREIGEHPWSWWRR